MCQILFITGQKNTTRKRFFFQCEIQCNQQNTDKALTEPVCIDQQCLVSKQNVMGSTPGRDTLFFVL